jgi:hypothetical protein
MTLLFAIVRVWFAGVNSFMAAGGKTVFDFYIAARP